MRKTAALLSVLLALTAVPNLASAFSGTPMAAAAVVKTETNNPIINYNENTKAVLGRGQGLRQVALYYTGSAKNWCILAKASGKNCDETVMRHLPVGMVVVIPQQLLKKSELRPSPSAELYKVEVGITERLLVDRTDLQKELADARLELMYWRAVCALLVAIALLVACVSIKSIRLHQRNYKDLETEVEHCKKVIPGNSMDFPTRESGVIAAMITKVELDEKNRIVVTEVKCLEQVKSPTGYDVICGIKTRPENYLSHWSQQHRKLLITTECMITELPKK